MYKIFSLEKKKRKINALRFQFHVFNPLKSQLISHLIHLKAYYSVSTMNYSVTTVKLMGMACHYEHEECKSGPADGSWEIQRFNLMDFLLVLFTRDSLV